MRLAEGVIVDRAVEHPHPGGVPVIVDQIFVGATIEELFDEREVAGSRREHQRRRRNRFCGRPRQTAILQYGFRRALEIGPQQPLAHRRDRARGAPHRVFGIVGEAIVLGGIDESPSVQRPFETAQQVPFMSERERGGELGFPGRASRYRRLVHAKARNRTCFA